MEIIVEGWRAGVQEWRDIQGVPVQELPPLSNEQREVAMKLRIPEVDYARSALAGRRTQERLLTKTQRFAHLLEQKLQRDHEGVALTRIRLVTIEHMFQLDLTAGDRNLTVRISEDMVDDLVEGGSPSADQQIDHVLNRVLAGQAA